MIVSVAHSKGGCGKSLLSLNLAPLVNNLILIDLDTQNSISQINQFRDKKFQIYQAKKQDELFSVLDNNEDKDIIIDCGGIDSDINRLAVVNSDIVIVPVKDNSFEILAFKRYIKVIEKLIEKNPNLKVLAVLNNVHAQSKDFERLKNLVAKYDFIKLAKSIIRTRADFANYLEAGTTVYEKDKTKKASNEIKKLYEEIKEVIDG